MQVQALTDIGRKRQVNQDYIFESIDPVGAFPNLFILADGMGGHKGGDFASKYLTETMVGYVSRANSCDIVKVLRNAIDLANALILEKSHSDEALRGMGSTLVAGVITGNILTAANIGDSRLYIIRDGITQVTRDHSLVEEMVAQGKMERDSEFYRLQKNIITRAMGISPQVRIDFFEVPLMEGDCVLLCSDGLTNMVDDAGISRILKTTDTLEEKTEALIHAANENGGKDNIAVVLVEPQISEVRL